MVQLVTYGVHHYLWVSLVTTKMKSYCVELIICIDLDNKYVRGNKNILIVFTV